MRFFSDQKRALHLLRDVDLEHGKHVEDGVLDADAEGQTGLLEGGVCALNAAVAVEAVEGAGEVDDEAVDPAGVILLGGHDDLLREGGQHPNQVHLGGLGQQGGVHLLGTGKLHALALHLLQDGADAGMGILHIVHRVVVVGLDGLIQVEVDAAAGVVHVEQEAGAVDGHLFQQVGQGDGVAGALGHADGLTVAHQVDHLHQDDVEVVAVQADGVHGALHAGNMAVVVGTPDVDGFGKTAGGQLVVVVRDVGGEVGGDAVGADEDLVLGFLFGAVLGLLLVDGAVLGCVLGTAVHHSAVLGLVAGAQLQQLVHHGHHRAGLVQGALVEPDIVIDAVLAEVALEGSNVLGQGVVHEGVLQGLEGFAGEQLLFAHPLAGGHIGVAVDLGELTGQYLDVAALIALGGQGIGLLAAELLQIADGKALAELLDLVARVVDVELTGHIVARPVEDGSKAVAQSAAAGVAHVHGAGGVGGNELHVVLGTLAVVGAAVLLIGTSAQHHAGPEGLGQEQVDEAGAGHLDLGEDAALDGGQMGNEGIGDHLGGLAPRAGTGHGEVGGNIAVLDVGGDLHDESGQLGFGQGAVGHGGLGSLGQQSTGLIQRRLTGIVVLVGLFKVCHLVDPFL